MNTEQLTRLAQYADGVIGRPDDRLAGVHARIRVARRRRAAAVVLGTAVLVLATLLGAMAMRSSSNLHEPAPAPKPERLEPAPSGPTRPLTWSDEFWPTRRIHYGDQVVDARRAFSKYDLSTYDFATMDLTDEGIVLTTVDGRVWFADHSSDPSSGNRGDSTVRPIATTGVRSRFLGLLDVRTGDTGTLAAWVDKRALIVFDTAKGRVVARHRCSDGYCSIRWVGPDSVYLENQEGGHRILRVAAGNGQASVVSARAVTRAMLNQPRALVVGKSFGSGQAGHGLDLDFVRQGKQLRPLQVANAGQDGFATAFDTSGHPLRFHLPTGYDRARSFTTFQWIDDDRLAMMAGAGGTGFVPGSDPDQPEDNTGYGDIIECQLSTGNCRVAVSGPGGYHDRDDDGMRDRVRIVPHFGTPGTN